MYRKQKRLMSIILSTLMVSSVFYTPVSVFATEDAKTHNNNTSKIFDDVKKIYNNNSTSIQKLQEKYAKMYDLQEGMQKIKLAPSDTVRFIVELKDKSVKEYAQEKYNTLKDGLKDEQLEERVLQSQESVKNQVKNICGNSQIRHSYTVLLNGFSIEGKYGDKERIEKLPGVKNVTVAKMYYPNMHKAKDLTKTREAWSYGYTGKGTAVAIIDTGMDPNHQDMRLSDPSTAKITNTNPEGAGKYFNDKIPYGHNYADGNNDVVDHRITSHGYQHGMHVGGTVGSNTKGEEGLGGVKGVAPEAQLFAMKVFTNNPAIKGAFGDDQVSAIEDAVKHGADVLNMSLGGSADFQNPEDAVAIALNNAIDAGVVPVLAAGNAAYSTSSKKFSGVYDTGTVGAPGNTHESIAVASSNNDIRIGDALTYKSGSAQGEMFYVPTDNHPVPMLEEQELSLVDCGNGEEKDYQDKDFSGNKIALVKYGVVRSSKTIRVNATKAGAKAVIIYREGDEAGSGMFKDLTLVPAAWIQGTKGQVLKNELAKGEVKICFPKGKVSQVENPSKGDMSDFSSWGPTPNLDFKPDITAPGGNIWSTGNTFEGGYLDMSGTSMASPHVAGGMALIMQRINEMVKKGEISFNTNRERIEFAKALALNTAIPMIEATPEGNVPFSPRRQGAGLMDNRAASQNYVTVTCEGEALVPLREIANTKTFTLKLHNYSKNNVDYNVASLTPGILTDASDLDGKNIQGMAYDKLIPNSNISFDKNEVSVEAGKDAFVTVTINIPAQTTKNIFAEGFIRFIPKNVTEGKYVPEIGTAFMGFCGKWDEGIILDKPIWDENAKVGLTALIDSEGNLLGQEGKNINSDKIAITNDLVGNQEAIPTFTIFRNAKEFITEILDSNGNVVTQLSYNKNVVKNVFPEEDTQYKVGSTWDGSVYNADTQKYEDVKDGQYYFRLKTKVDYKDAKFQEIKMPIKVDSIAPNVEIQSIEPVKQDIYKLLVKANDDASITKSGVNGFVVIVNDEPIKKFIPFNPNEKGIQEIEIKLASKAEKVAVVAFDYAGNMTVDYADNEFKIQVIGDLDGRLQTNEKEFKIKGSVTAMPDELKINKVDVKVNPDLTFETIVKVEPGKLNKVPVYGKKDKIVLDYAYNVYCDVLAPEIIMQNPVFKNGETSKIVTVPQDTKEYTVKFKAKDDMFGYSVFINEKQMDTVMFYPLQPNKTEKEFIIPVKLTGDTTNVKLTLRDDCKNVTERTITIVKDKAKVLQIKPIGFKDKYNNGDKINGGIEVKNTGSEKKEVTLLVAIYDENNKMLKMASKHEFVNGGEEKTLNVNLDMPNVGKNTVKYFVWDNIETMNPLLPVSIIK